MEVAEILKEKRSDILRIADKHGACNVRVFGSAARGEAGAYSDVDIVRLTGFTGTFGTV